MDRDAEKETSWKRRLKNMKVKKEKGKKEKI